jgi:translation initiation factor IF-2
VYEDKVIGHAEVRQTFKIKSVGVIAGCIVRDGWPSVTPKRVRRGE